MLYRIIYKSLFFIVCSVVLQISAWTAGTFEEKYYVLLDRRDTTFDRMLEKSFFDYARAHNVNLVLYSVDDYNINNKTDILYRGANNLYPVLISSRYDKTLLQSTENEFFKKGESSLDGTMGSFIFIGEPEKHKRDFAFRLPWHSIAFDTTKMSVEMMRALGQEITPDSIDSLQAMSTKAIHSYTQRTIPTKNTVLVIINGFSVEEHNLYTTILKKLQILNTDETIQFLPLYIDDTINPNIKKQKEESIPKEISEKKEQSEKEQTLSFSIRDSTTYQNLLKYNKKYGISHTATTIIAPSDTEAFITRAFFIKEYITNTAPTMIGFGNSEEGKQEMQKGNESALLLTFDIDYDAYVTLIMKHAKTLYQKVQHYPLSYAKLEGKEAYKTFTDTEDLFPIRPIHKK